MAEGQAKLLSGATPVPRLDARYELADRAGVSLGGMPLATLQNMIRQGRLFRTDRVSKNGAPWQTLGELGEFDTTFDEVLPAGFAVEGTPLRPTPEFAGVVEPLGLVRVFVRIYRGHRTGRLFVRDDDGREKVVVFRQGVPVNAMSNIEDEWIGEVLIQQGLIDQEAFLEAVELRRQNGARIGSALVYLDKLSPRDLQRALAVQAMERLVNVFGQRSGGFRFIADDTAADEEVRLVASPRDIIETALASALSGEEIGAHLSELGDPNFDVRVPPELAEDLSDADRAALRILESGSPLSAAIPAIAQATRLTTAEARLRVLLLWQIGAARPAGGAADEALRQVLEGLQSQDYFSVLDVRRLATPEEVDAACKKRLAALLGEDAAAGPVAHQIRGLHERARLVLRDPTERALYERALHLGLDFDQPEVRQRVEYDHFIAEGKSLLHQQRYQEAKSSFVAAGERMPDDPLIYVHVGWAQFLASARDTTAAAAAIREVERALRLSSDLDEAYLTLGKIYRLSGDLKRAEDNLRRAIELNPHQHEAQSELRVLFTRELDAKSGGLGTVKVDLSGPVLRTGLAVVAVFILTLIGANFIDGGATQWPNSATVMLGHGLGEDEVMNNIAERVNLRLRPTDEQLVTVARALGADAMVATREDALRFLDPISMSKIRVALAELDKVPPQLQRMGNQEHFYVPSDGWWWTRRGLLLVLGLLGLLLLRREKLSDVSIFGASPNWILAALPYGLAVGILSPFPETSTPMALLLCMTLFHVIAEQTFFIAFVGRGLIKDLGHPVAGILATAAIFGLYHVTYFGTFQVFGPGSIVVLAQIGLFAGGAYALLLWRSGGMLAPFLAHLIVNSTMMVRSALSQTG